MAQPDNFGFGEEAALLKESARKFFADNFPTDQLHVLVATDPDPYRPVAAPWREDLWRQMVELGWTALAVPESAGGVAMPLSAVAGLVEEAGHAAFPCPLLGTLNTIYVLSGCGPEGEAALSAIAQGHAATLAITNRQGSWDVSRCDVRLAQNSLDGTAWYVQDAGKVSHLLVSAYDGERLCLYWVDVTAPGVTVTPDAIIDLTRDQAHVTFQNVVVDGQRVTEVCTDAVPVLKAAMPAIWTLLAADMVGAGEWLLQTTTEYARTRQQFDRPLGFFQAIKHPLVNVMIEVDKSKSLVYNAACAFDSEPDKATGYAHMAKSAASDMASFGSSRAVQFHGGIGFTWECYVHLYFKRQKHSQLFFGDGPWHRRRLALSLIDREAHAG
ncbi:MAG: acyl-CoA/acyl-ACP dehydrogenase [Gammaproteobacteria bacterium]|nr:acyl-CoA/acyl-ACP dehydrogenase [Gammaproteobacteria bacterium]